MSRARPGPQRLCAKRVRSERERDPFDARAGLTVGCETFADARGECVQLLLVESVDQLHPQPQDTLSPVLQAVRQDRSLRRDGCRDGTLDERFGTVWLLRAIDWALLGLGLVVFLKAPRARRPLVPLLAIGAAYLASTPAFAMAEGTT